MGNLGRPLIDNPGETTPTKGDHCYTKRTPLRHTRGNHWGKWGDDFYKISGNHTARHGARGGDSTKQEEATQSKGRPLKARGNDCCALSGDNSYITNQVETTHA